jgi:predicted kinase
MPGWPPLLVIVSGKPGAGKTTLAARLSGSDALGLHVLSRDAIKVGLVETRGAETDEVRSVIVPRSFDLFFETIELWLRAGVSLIAEYGFAGWAEPRLRALVPLARTVLLYCDTPDEVAARRFIARERLNPRARPDILAGDRRADGARDVRLAERRPVRHRRADAARGHDARLRPRPGRDRRVLPGGRTRRAGRVPGSIAGSYATIRQAAPAANSSRAFPSSAWCLKVGATPTRAGSRRPYASLSGA